MILFGFGRFVGFVVGTVAIRAVTNAAAMSIEIHTIAIHGDDVVTATTTTALLECEQLLGFLYIANAARRFRGIEWEMDFRDDRRRMRSGMWLSPLFTLIQIDIVYCMVLNVAIDDAAIIM